MQPMLRDEVLVETSNYANDCAGNEISEWIGKSHPGQPKLVEIVKAV